MNKITSILAAIMLAGGITCAAQAKATEDVVIVYDASGSMWSQIDGTSKTEIAREVMADLINKWNTDIPLGLVAYGHRRQGDCTDIETLIEPGPLNKVNFIKTVNAIMPKGKTPISASLQHAADLLSYRDSQATIILISDGLETCNADPCALSEQLAKQGVKLTAHVVGFDLETKVHANLSCIAENTGGIFVPANNAAELHNALAQVQSVMDQEPSTPEAKPEPEPEQAPPEVEISGPKQATTGAAFDVAWSKTISHTDMITIVPVGADPGTRHNYRRTGKKDTAGRLIAPAEPGLYELRYMLDAGKKTLATAPIEVIEAEIEVSGPEQATTGAAFDVAWSKTISHTDMITIVPVGADPGTRHNYRRTGKKDTAGRLIAPAQPGLYELRYMLDEGKKTLATAPIEVVEVEIEVTAPAQAVTGAAFDIAWNTTIHSNDFMTIVPAGADAGLRRNHIRTRDKNSGRLIAPAEPGLYEVRYVLEEGKKTIGKADIEVVEPEISISGPAIVRAETTVDITWSSTIHRQDFVTIVPVGSKESLRASYHHLRVGDKTTGRLKAPTEPGLYEIRYVLEEGKKMLASTSLEVVAADAPLDDGAGLSVPKTAAIGETITITWSGGSDSTDQRISLARANQADFSWIAAQAVGAEKTIQLTMPDKAGFYEVRFLDIAGRELLGRSIVEVK
ncbi:MAG TPA: VWA domain-containing protein [Thiopseudomonas sp.]|nr:VWA domain-containing protein [Thiopseudomonas sp.]